MSDLAKMSVLVLLIIALSFFIKSRNKWVRRLAGLGIIVLYMATAVVTYAAITGCK